MSTQDPTTNYNWNLPDVAGDGGAWGALLNAIIGDDVTGIDAVVKAVSVVANAALARAGGTMTGEVILHSDRYSEVALGNMVTTTAINLASGRFFRGTLTGSTVLSFSNVPATGLVYVLLEIVNGGAFTITWPESVRWSGSVTPALLSSGVSMIALYTRDGGVTWRGALSYSGT